MKKIIISAIILLLIILSTTAVLATNNENLNTTKEYKETTGSSIMDKKEKVKEEVDEHVKKIDKYVKDYDNSKTYGTVAYILDMVRKYSIPLCFIGIAIGGIYQYAIGTRRLDMKQKGFALILSFVTLLVICQVLPLIFVVVVRGWGG